MKKHENFFNRTLLPLILLTSFLIGCDDPELRFQTFENSKKGAYARKLSETGKFLSTTTESQIVLSVEFYDENQGQNVAAYSWSVRFLPQGDVSANDPEVFLFEIQSQQFSESDSGLPGVTFFLSKRQAIDGLGLDGTSIQKDDVFRFEATLRMKDGSEFSAQNTGPNMISQSPFNALFRLDAKVF